MSSRRKILLIDYDPESIESTRAPLVKAGYEVEVASDGIAGVEAFQRLEPDLVLIEPMVPKKHGFQVCKEIKATAAGRNTPVLITTGFYRGRKHRDEAHESYGCDDYLEKPIAEDLLLSTCGKFLIDTQEPPIPVPVEPTIPLSLAPAESQDPVADSADDLVDRLPEMPIPEEKAPSNLLALDDLTEDEIQERLDAMIIGEEDAPVAAPPMADPPQPAVAELPATPDEMQIPEFEVAETPPTPAFEPSPTPDPPVATEVAAEIAVAMPVHEQPAASPKVAGPTAPVSEATVESLLARKSTRCDVSGDASEPVAAAEPEIAPFVEDERPARSRLPLWVGIAAGVFIVVGMTILWMLRDQGAADPSVEVAAMSIGGATSAPSHAPASTSPMALPFDPAPGPDAAIVFGAVAETDAHPTSSPQNPEPASAGELHAANDTALQDRTQFAALQPTVTQPLKTQPEATEPPSPRPAAPQPSSSPAEAVVDQEQPRGADLPGNAPAAATTTAVAAELSSKPQQVDAAIDEFASAPKESQPEPEPVREAVTSTETETDETETEQMAPATSPPPPAKIDLSPVPIVIPEIETASAPPAEPPAPKTRRGDLVDLAELDRIPRAKIKPMPEYPVAAQSMRLEGTVNLRLLVDERGQVEQIEIDSGTKSKQLQRAAVAAAERWVYEPGIKDGVPVKVWITSSVQFKL